MILFGNLIELGVNTEMEFYQKREARMVNLFAIITLFGLLIGVSSAFFISGTYPTPTIIFSTITSLIILILNGKNFHNTATCFFVLSINLIIFIINQEYIEAVGNYLFYFPVIFCVALLHNPLKSNTRTVIFFGIIIISFVATKIFHISSLKINDISESDNKILFNYNSYITVLITIILVYLVVKLINRQNNEALGLLKKEQNAQLIISQSLKEKEVLLAEIQHRVKNNLAIITGLLNLQTEKAPCEVSKQLMIDSRNRVMSMAMVHDRLYKKDNLSKIDLSLYLSELIKEIALSFPVKIPAIVIVEEMILVDIEIVRAVPIGLIVNEAITNAFKHAFDKSINTPIIKLKMEVIFDKIQIVLSDNGLGFPENKNTNDNSLGLSLIQSLADQIDADVTFSNESGAVIKLLFLY